MKSKTTQVHSDSTNLTAPPTISCMISNDQIINQKNKNPTFDGQEPITPLKYQSVARKMDINPINLLLRPIPK